MIIAQGLFSFQIGGSERVGADLALELARRGHKVVCFAFYDTAGPIREELEQAGIECLDLNYKTRPRLTRRFTYQLEFYRFLKKHRVEALLVHHATALILCGLPARAARIPRVVMVEHGLHQLRDRPDYRRSAKRYCGFADHVVGIDPTITEYFGTQMGVPHDRLHYIANGVKIPDDDPALRSATRDSLGIRDDEFLLLSVGRLVPEKDLATLLEATARSTAASAGKLRVLIAGDGSERPMLEARAAELNLWETVTFLGMRRDIRSLMAAANGFIMTSVTEGQPMALIEAMASGLPCIGTSVGGIPGLLRDGAGVLVPAGNPGSIAQAIDSMVSDPLGRTEMANRSRERVQTRHGLEAVVDRYLRLLEPA